MSDDIVTRLREIADSEVYRADISVSKLYEAADEIERLQKIISDLKGLEMCDPNDPCEMCKE